MAAVRNGKVLHSHRNPYIAVFLNSFPFQGFTAIVNKALSAKYERLVNHAPELIKTLPWGQDFEVDVFRKPDFTALEVLSFANGGTLLIQLIYVFITPSGRYIIWNQCEL